MFERKKHIQHLLAAELQFRLASSVRLATTLHKQPLDIPTEWVHGQHSVRYEDVVLQQDQADYAAFLLRRSATYTMAVAIKDAVEAVVPGLPKAVRKAGDEIELSVRKVIQEVETKSWICSDDDVIVTYHIARLIRNAYAHAPFAPVWIIHKKLRDKVFNIPDIIRLDTKNLHGTPFDWQHYGGPLAMFHFCQFTRIKVLGDQLKSRQALSIPNDVIYQQGDLIIQKVDELPQDAKPVDVKRLPNGGIPLGGGHVLYPRNETQDDDI